MYHNSSIIRTRKVFPLSCLKGCKRSSRTLQRRSWRWTATWPCGSWIWAERTRASWWKTSTSSSTAPPPSALMSRSSRSYFIFTFCSVPQHFHLWFVEGSDDQAGSRGIYRSYFISRLGSESSSVDRLFLLFAVSRETKHLARFASCFLLNRRRCYCWCFVFTVFKKSFHLFVSFIVSTLMGCESV